MSGVVRWSEPRVLLPLDNWSFQLVVDAHAFSAAVQRSGSVVGVEGTPDDLALRRRMDWLNTRKVDHEDHLEGG